MASLRIHYLHPTIQNNTLAPSTHIPAFKDLTSLQNALELEIVSCREKRIPAAPLEILKASIPVIKTDLQAARFSNPEKVSLLVTTLGSTMVEEFKKLPAQRAYQCWALYLENANQPPDSLPQLFAGLNLVLNFQFGLTAQEVLDKDEADSLEADMHCLLAAVSRGFARTYEVHTGKRPLARLLSFSGAFSSTHYGHFSLRKAMQHAWVATSRLVKSHPAELSKKVMDLDSYVVVLSRLIYEPGLLFRGVSWFFRL
ncbi:MAG: hypothetical protein D6816_13555 [Bacteroidetes bacterium]|nr:MAG: hypothetical protein D6816_13555 [Bacteroidota bacterium]